MPVVWSTPTGISFIYTGTFVSWLLFSKYNTYEPKRIVPDAGGESVYPQIANGERYWWPNSWPGGGWDGDVASTFQMGHTAFKLSPGMSATITRVRWYPQPGGGHVGMDGSSFYASTEPRAYADFRNYGNPSADLNWVTQNISGTAIAPGWELICAWSVCSARSCSIRGLTRALPSRARVACARPPQTEFPTMRRGRAGTSTSSPSR